MEHFCGAVGQHMKNRQNPYASLDQRVWDLAQLQMVKLKYGLIDELPPKHLNADIRNGGITFEDGPCRCIRLMVLTGDLVMLSPKIITTRCYHQKGISKSTTGYRRS